MERSTSRPFAGSTGGFGLLFIVLLGAIVAGALRSEAQPPRETAPVRAIGTLQAMAGGPDGPVIELPDVTVYLEDPNHRRAAAAMTALDGSFELFAAPGSYRLCYDGAGASGCGPGVALVDSTVLVGDVAVDARPSLYGTVLTGDGRPCWISDAYFGLDVSTRVSVFPGATEGAARAQTRANVQGEYAVFGLAPAAYRVAASCEQARIAAAADPSAGPEVVNLVLPNHAPVVPDAAPLARNQSALRAAVPEAMPELRVNATDPDRGDTVRYIWRTQGGGSRTSHGATPNAQFQSRAAEGREIVYLMAVDGRGGFTYRRFDRARTRSGGIIASGRAVDEATGAPVRDAAVSFGSARGRTDANGWFAIESAGRRDDRYVLNIRHADYTLLSRVLESDARGVSYAMAPVQAARVDAGAAIRLLDRTSGGMCAAGTRSPACMTRGARVTLSANALADAGGARAVGTVRAAVATIDPARPTLPGLPGRGRAARALLNVGAVEVRFSDAQGRPLNLRPGRTAEIRLPLDPAQAAGAPPTARMSTYDEENGRWVAGGLARLVRNAEGAFYVGRTRHFSTINMNIELNPLNATCVRVELDSGFSNWTDLSLRAYVTFGTTTVDQVVTLDANQFHGIFALPYVRGNTIRLQLSGKFNRIPLDVMSDVVPFGPPRPRMTGATLIPPYPYDECGAPIRLSPQGAVPAFGVIDATGRPAFLTGPKGTFNPATPQGAAYYAAIDPGNTRTTLGDWWRANGFDQNGQGGTNATFTRASYMNHNDLGFGRDMHCLVPQAGRLACYVTNYGLPDQNPQNANDAADRNPVTRGATVAMEYDASAGAGAVQFYVFNQGVGSATRIEFADLDGLGPKPVPHLCMVCHGGIFGADNRVQWARFREFDLPSFRYRDGATWDYGQPAPAGLDAAAFARLNRMVGDIHPGTPIAALIAAWYDNAGGPLPVEPAPPAGWLSEAAAYHGVYGQTCRTCHLARDEGRPPDRYPYLVFDTADNFSGTDYAVCGSGRGSQKRLRLMPNALITYRNLWLESDRPRVKMFEDFTGASGCGS